MQTLFPISGYANYKVLRLYVLSYFLFNIGLFTIPTRIFLIVAPTNVLLNYLLGSFFLPFPLSKY